jgi:GlcNAc-P-P-Und epimerase
MDHKKIAIIGGSGFLGTRLADQLTKENINFEIFDIASSPKYKSTTLDVEDIESLKVLSKSNVFINLAAVHRDDIKPLSRYDDVNVQGAVNVCDEARRNNVNKIIFTSSVAIYGFAPPETDEQGEPNYFNDYGRTKYLAEKVYKKWLSEDKKNRTLVIIRPTVIFGEGNRGNVYNLLKQIQSRKFIMFGNGKNSKSMAYVENVASFIKYSMNFDTGLHIYNYIDKPDFDMNKLIKETRKILFNKNNIGIRLPGFLGIFIGYAADLFGKISGRALPVSSIRVKKFMSTTSFSSSINETGFIANAKLEDGLSNTLKYEFMEDNSEKPIFETE